MDSKTSAQPKVGVKLDDDGSEEFVPCTVPHCGVKVPEEEPRLDFATFIEQENLLSFLKNQEVKDITSADPLAVNDEPTTSNVGYKRTGG